MKTKILIILLWVPLCVSGESINLKTISAKNVSGNNQPLNKKMGKKTTKVMERNFYKINLGADVPFQMGIQGQYHFAQIPHYYAKGGAGFAISAFMKLRERLLKQFHFPLDHYEQTLVELMTHSVVFDARLGWAKHVDEGAYIELGYRLMVWGEELTMNAQRIKKVFDYTVNVANNKTTGEQNIFHVDMLNHGPTFHIGYAFLLMDQFFLNMELGVHKPLLGLSEFSLRSSLNNNTNSEMIHHLIRGDLWIFSVGLWLGFVF